VKSNALLSAGSRLLLLALLAGCSSVPGFQWAGGERLAPCTMVGGPFEKIELKKWPETYHGTVSKVIEAHLKQLGDASSAEISCTASDYPSMMKASGELRSLASSLPPWKGRSVSELEIGPVLLEYLRVYECSLQDKRYYLALSPLQQSSSTSSRAPGPTLGEYNEQISEEEALINRESVSARPILERTLTIVGGLDRLRPMALDIECLTRSSLDLRNTLGLTAEAAACMPRIWDTRGSLRDLPDPDPVPAE